MSLSQDGLAPMPKDRGAEQGDADGPLECSLALGMVAAETWGRVAARQASGSLPRIGVDDPSDVQRLQAERAVRLQETANVQLGGPEQLTGANEPRHELQRNGGLADLSYHGSMVTFCVTRSWCRRTCKNSTSPTPTSERSGTHRTQVINYVNDLDAVPLEWRIRDVQNMAKVSTVTAGSIRLGVAVGPRLHIADQLLGKADVIRAMHERLQLCQDPQTEFALLRESFGSQPHQPHPASSRSHNPSGIVGCGNQR